MAISHVAIVRSSARMAHQKAANESQQQQDPTTKESSSTKSDSNIEQSLTNELSQMSVISISSGSEGGDISHEMSVRQPKTISQSSDSLSTTMGRVATAPPRPMAAPLAHLDTVSDIEACLDSDLHQINVLNKLEQKWSSLLANFDTILNHLQECSDEVTEASTSCLQSLVGSIEITCDKVDSEMKALYHLMTRCDELTTKLSVASSFRDEVKTLRKSVETLENLYKLKPQVSHQRSSPNS